MQAKALLDTVIGDLILFQFCELPASLLQSLELNSVCTTMVVILSDLSRF